MPTGSSKNAPCSVSTSRVPPPSANSSTEASETEASATDGPPPPAGPDRIDPAVWRVAFTQIVGALAVTFDATIVSVALNDLAGDLDASLATIQWVTTGYLLALAAVLPVAGWVTGRFGARQVYIWSIAAFALGSLACGLADSIGQLITFRVLQGAAAALAGPAATMISNRSAIVV